MNYISTYVAMMGGFLVLDAIWLGVVAKSFYQKHIGSLMAANPNFIAAGVFYTVYILGLFVLVVEPAVRANDLTQALARGALFGLVCYATYDLTSQAVIKNWPISVTIVDLCWGVTASTIVAYIGYIAGSKLL